MVWHKCSKCGHKEWVEETHLSNIVHALLSAAPEDFRNGKPVSLARWQELTDYSFTHIHRGLRELCKLGYASTIRYNARSVQYVGVPSMLTTSELLKAVA